MTAGHGPVHGTEAWDEAHWQAYGEGAWPRVRRLSWTLTKRHIGYSPGDIGLIESGRVDTPGARRERTATWLPAAQLLALALWRAARSEDVLVDDVPLTRALWWLGGAHHDGLFTGPLPVWEPGLPGGGWQRLQRRGEQVLGPARDIVTGQVLQDRSENRALRDTQDGTPEPPLLLGDRYRAVAAGPSRDGAPPRWQGTVDHAQRSITRASDELRAGHWTPGPDATAAAAILLPTLGADPDAPALPPGVTGPAWIQRAVRLAHIHATIRTVQLHHRHADELDSHPAQLLGLALAAVTVALGDFGPAAAELEGLWDRRTTGIASWERAHLPGAVRGHITTLEALTTALAGLCIDLTHPNEEH
ncbi:hypothetical protein ACWGDX_29515 [Streptomyces sp. NPDC055025]